MILLISLLILEIAMTNFEFNEITQSNWQEPDKVSASMLTIDNWLRHMLKPKLIGSVPKEVQALFEVARSAMIYGYYFFLFIPLVLSSYFVLPKQQFHTSVKH